jgi:hypothetical protein
MTYKTRMMSKTNMGTFRELPSQASIDKSRKETYTT